MLDDKGHPRRVEEGESCLLFKKGDRALPSNYRLISLLAVGYKNLASMLHQRLLRGGAEERMRSSQFGFRPRRGTADARMLIRRIVDAANVDDAGGVTILLLDWAKAFDRLKPDCLCAALLRFGIPSPVV